MNILKGLLYFVKVAGQQGKATGTKRHGWLEPRQIAAEILGIL